MGVSVGGSGVAVDVAVGEGLGVGVQVVVAAGGKVAVGIDGTATSTIADTPEICGVVQAALPMINPTKTSELAQRIRWRNKPVNIGPQDTVGA